MSSTSSNSSPTALLPWNNIVMRFFYVSLPTFIWTSIRLLGLTIFLSPGYIRLMWYYFGTSQRKSIRYGNKSCRQTLDVYYHLNGGDAEVDVTGFKDATTLRPVVIFYTGGGWVMGHKMWGTLLARVFQVAGIVVVVPDLRNFPFGNIPLMLEDVDLSIQWTFDNIIKSGGDPTKIVVVGQSAGGHLCCTVLLQRILQQFQQQQGHTDSEKSMMDEEDQNAESKILRSASTASWIPHDLLGFVSLSTPYCLTTVMDDILVRHAISKGFIAGVLFGARGGEHGSTYRDRYDPIQLLRQLKKQKSQNDIGSMLPKNIQLYHGNRDQIVPCCVAANFYHELCQILIEARLSSARPGHHNNHTNTNQIILDCHMYDYLSHTDSTFERPMAGDHRFHQDLFNLLKVWTTSAKAKTRAGEESEAPAYAHHHQLGLWPEHHPTIRDQFCPPILVEAAIVCNPL